MLAPLRSLASGLLVLAALLSCGGAGEPAPSSGSLPSSEDPGRARRGLYFESVLHQYGTIDQGDVVHAEFSFENHYDFPVRITAVERSCGCAHTQSEEGDIAPGATSLVVIDYDSAKIKGDRISTITLNFAPEGVPKAVLTLRGTVRASLTVPAMLAMGRLEPGEAVTRTAKILRTPDADEVWLGAIEGEQVEAELSSVEGSGFELRVEVTAGLAPGSARLGIPVRYRLREALGAKEMVKVLTVGWIVPQALQVVPARIELKEGVATFQVRQQWRSRIRYECVGDPEEVLVRRSAERRDADLFEVRYDAARGPLPDEAAVRITSDDPRFEEMRIPLGPGGG